MSTGAPKPVLGPRLHELDLSHADGAIGQARHFVGQVLAQWFAFAPGTSTTTTITSTNAVTDPDRTRPIQDRFIQDMLILVSEVVTNACVHTSGPLGMLVDCTPERLRIEVTDPSSVTPKPREPGPEWPGGYGLLVVQRLTRAWGSEPRGEGKAVWLEVDWPDWDLRPLQ